MEHPIIERNAVEITAPSYVDEAPLPGGAVSTAPVFSLGMLLRHKWTVLGVFFLIAAVAVPSVWLLVVPEYRATAMVRVRPVIPRMLYKYEDNGIIPLYTSYMLTQVSTVRNPTILEQVIDDPEIQQTQWYRNPPKPLLRNPLPPLHRLRKALSASPRRGTEYIEISMTTRNPKDGKIIVDKVVKYYLNYADTAEQQTDEQKLAFLQEKQTEFKNAIEGLVRTRNILENNLGTSEPGEIRTRVAERLIKLEQEYDNLQLERDLNQWRLDYLQSELAKHEDKSGEPDGSASDGQDTPTHYERDETWRDRHLAYMAAKHQVAVARQNLGENHPRIKELTANVEYALSMQRQREKELDNPALAPLAVVTTGEAQPMTYDEGAIQRAIAEGQFRESQLTAAIELQRKKVQDINEQAQTIERLNEEIKQKRANLAEVSDRLNVIRVEKEAVKEIGRVSLAAAAVEPAEPSKDRRAVLSVLFLALAAGAGIGSGYLRAVLDPSVREAQDVRSTVHIPFLGFLPKAKFEAELCDDSCTVLREHVRMVRTALLDRLPPDRSSSIVVTSPGPQAGKTSLAILLAKSLVQTGKKVLLVDGDLRHPTLAERLNLKSQPGLTDVLAGRAKESEAFQKNGHECLDTLVAGSVVDEADMEKMANGQLRRRLEEWKQRYDCVIFDAPPVLPVADARILAAMTDGAVLTLRAAHCRRSEAVQAIEEIASAGGTTVGTVLVGADRHSIRSGMEQYYRPRKAITSTSTS